MEDHLQQSTGIPASPQIQAQPPGDRGAAAVRGALPKPAGQTDLRPGALRDHRLQRHHDAHRIPSNHPVADRQVGPLMHEQCDLPPVHRTRKILEAETNRSEL